MTFYVQVDAPQMIREQLRSSPVLPGGVRVRDELPDDWSPTDLEPATVTVSEAGTPTAGVATSTENVHVAVYSRWRPEARDLAVLIDGWLLDPRNTHGLALSPGPGLLCAKDDDTGGWVCSITVVADAPKKGVNVNV